MKLALAQMKMEKEISENLNKSLQYCDMAENCDLLFFSEIQLTPFFPQYHNRCVDHYCMDINDDALQRLAQKAKEHKYYLSPNVYLESDGARYDTSLWIGPDGRIQDTAKMVHIAQNTNFYEQDYYTPSDDGFKVFHTPFGNVGIVICFDRHIPESIRSCALKGADLIIVPTANTKAEPMEMFEWEMRVQAMQNQVFIAMCNRVGTEDKMQFAGESIVIHPGGEVIAKANDQEQLLTCDIDLNEVKKVRNNINYLSLRRPEQYESFYQLTLKALRAERMDKNKQWIDWIVELQSLAQAGLTYGKDVYDKERYERIRDISAEMIADISDMPPKKVKGLFCNETGYQTPKIDTRAAIFKDDKILLVHENNGTWSLPGGWCDVNVSVAENTIKEVKEEAGLDVSVKSVIAIQDREKHNLPIYAYRVCKIFMLCSVTGGDFEENIETTGFDYFAEDELPELAGEKNNEEQIRMCFDAYRAGENWKTFFD